MSTRKEVYECINKERDHQDGLPIARMDGCAKTVGDHLVMLDSYVVKAKMDWTDNAGVERPLHQIRKIAAIAVRCLEEHGVRNRGE